MKYNLRLMKSLNKEYSKKPFVNEFRVYTIEEQIDYAKKRVEELGRKINLYGLKVLEIGCGGGVCIIHTCIRI